MKVRNIQIAIIFCIVGFLFFASCKKFVEVEAPTTQLATSSVFANSATATAAQTVIYSNMVNYSESLLMAEYTGWLGDELTNYSSALNNVLYYTNSMTATQTAGAWNDAYKYIYMANANIAGLQNNPAISSSIEQQLIGEAKFVRAFWFFYLTNLYGDVPLVISTDYTINATISRAPSATVYQQIIADLKDAQNLLSSNYLDATDTAVAKDRVRPTKSAATALLARVYLYTGDYADAEAAATAVINNNGMYSLASLSNVFLANSTEAIWQLGIPAPNGYDTPDGKYFILLGAPSSTGSGSAISPELLNSFESGDNRRITWVDSFKTTTSPVKIYYYPYKYTSLTAVSAGVTPKEYVMVLRLAEQYLIRSEARIHQGDSTGCLADLNVIRNRAGLGNYAGPRDVSSVLTAILHERQVELFTEWGHRWFDLIRTGNIGSVMSAVAPTKEGNWNTDNYQALSPIPQTERNLDPNLSQNPGY